MPKRKVKLKYAGPTVLFRANANLLADECEKLQKALHDLLKLYDRRDDSGWVFSDIRRLEEIRELVIRGS